MEARNRYAWQDGSDDGEPGDAGNMRLPAERVVPLGGRRRSGTAHRKAPEPRPVRQSKPVDTIVGRARPAPVPAEEAQASTAVVAPPERAVAAPPGLAERLREQQAELQARLARLEGEAMEFDEDSRPKYSNHPADEAVVQQDRASRDAVTRVLLDDIVQVEKALDRLAAGSYGLCADCHQPIPPKRLEARPTATLCVSCQSRREARAAGNRFVRH